MGFLDSTPNKLEKNYEPHFTRWQSKPDKTNTTALLSALEPEIRRGIHAHVGQSNPLIRSRAKKLTIQSLKTYDPSQAALGTHIVNSLQGLKRVNRKQTEIVAVPERIVYDRRYLDRAQAELEEELGREATMGELADRTGLSIRRINRVQQYNPAAAEGSFAYNPADGTANAGVAVNSRNHTPWEDVLYHDLDATNQKIMEWSLGLHGNQVLPNKEIARRLRISPGAVSQRKQRIQQMLDELTDLGGQM